jgi:hypothetical protein
MGPKVLKTESEIEKVIFSKRRKPKIQYYMYAKY